MFLGIQLDIYRFSFFCLLLHILLVIVGPHQPLPANCNLHFKVMMMMMMMMMVMMMMTKLRSTKHVLFVLSRRKQHPVPMPTATSFPGSLILLPLERVSSAPGSGNMRDLGNEVVHT